ncbi:bacteriohemerythrin [Magnetospirillum moscoviense]|uniref:Hemerythrin n=1 Tax=Magnetospirillum moscoviense TaxID=1437059 RepID=A0A178MZF6_9PROT|nr:bacteriohemerythrin [Magnetospirillum moscoviense]MBF0323583.1 hemerythrin family protein [Alphaproteobacteria bacterium]OAN64493.1 hemerythrin [Magnetospirillum moscoviense]
MGEHISWTDDLLTGVDAIDNDHKALIALMNAIFASTSHGPEAISSAIGELTSYTKHHFAAEQVIMEKAGYTGLSDHIYEHEHLVFQLERMIDGLMRMGAAGVDAELVRILRGWLVDHILGFDMKFAEFLRGKAS